LLLTVQTRELRICLVGMGSIARTHLAALGALPALRNLPFRPAVDAVVTRRASELRSSLAALGVARVYESLEQALAQDAPDAVIVATENDRHLADARAVLRARRPLYIEKPLGRTPEEAAEIAALAAASEQPVQVGLVLRYDPGVAAVRALYTAGAIGNLKQARLTSFHGSYLDPSRPLSWRMSRSRAGGGALLDLGLHLVDLARHLFGELDVAAASAHTFVADRPGGHADVDDWAWLELRTRAGASVTAESSRIAYGGEGAGIELYGDEGSLLCGLGSARAPRLRRFDGRESDWLRQAADDAPAAAVRNLLPPARESLGAFTDAHAASLHHFLLRVVGADPAPAVVPTAADSAAAEALVAEAIQLAAGREIAHV
jgi:predicted dehydrogenase